LVRFSDGRKYLSVAMCVWLLALLHMSLPFWFPTMRYPMVGSVDVDGSSLMYLYYSPCERSCSCSLDSWSSKGMNSILALIKPSMKEKIRMQEQGNKSIYSNSIKPFQHQFCTLPQIFSYSSKPLHFHFHLEPKPSLPSLFLPSQTSKPQTPPHINTTANQTHRDPAPRAGAAPCKPSSAPGFPSPGSLGQGGGPDLDPDPSGPHRSRREDADPRRW